MHILAFSLCKESDAHRTIATHYFKERGSIPYGTPLNELSNKAVPTEETEDWLYPSLFCPDDF